MAYTEPLEVVMEFIKRINVGDVYALCELKTEGHVFQDALGKRFVGRTLLRESWRSYFAEVADYKFHGEDCFQDKFAVAVFGDASGTTKRNGKFAKEGFWQIPAAWKAPVRGDKIAQ